MLFGEHAGCQAGGCLRGCVGGWEVCAVVNEGVKSAQRSGRPWKSLARGGFY